MASFESYEANESFDAFNDDTFGDSAEVWEEDDHKKLSEINEVERLYNGFSFLNSELPIPETSTPLFPPPQQPSFIDPAIVSLRFLTPPTNFETYNRPYRFVAPPPSFHICPPPSLHNTPPRYNNRETFGDEIVNSRQLRDRNGYLESTGNPSLDLLRESRNFSSSVNSTEDPYARLMTLKEQQWILNIQNLQLKIENPYKDDYYYTVYCQKKSDSSSSRTRNSGSQPKRNEEGPSYLLFNSLQSADRIYTPIQFDNSLGKLQVLSVYAPRRSIDVENSSLEPLECSPCTKDSKKFKQTLLELEQMFSLLISIEICEKKLAALPTNTPMRIQVENEKKESTARLAFSLTAGAHIHRYLLVRKGKVLLGRSLRHIGDKDVGVILYVLCSSLPNVMKRDKDDELLSSLLWPGILSHLSNSSYSNLFSYFKLLNGSKFSLVLTHSFGLSLLVSIVSRLFFFWEGGETVTHEVKPLFECLAEGIESNKKSFPSPYKDTIFPVSFPKVCWFFFDSETDNQQILHIHHQQHLKKLFQI